MAKQNLIEPVNLYFKELEESDEDAIRYFNRYENKFDTLWKESEEREIDFGECDRNKIKEKLEEMKTLLRYKGSTNL